MVSPQDPRSPTDSAAPKLAADATSRNPPHGGPSGARARAGRKEWVGLAVIALPCLLYSMDLTVLHLAVPSLSRDLAPSSTQLLWIIDIYGFLVAGSLITAGTLGDRIGRRRLLLIGAGLFGAASILAAFSTSPEMLIATRALLGIAGATVAPSTLSLIRNMFLDPRERTVAVSLWMSSYSIGSAIGPLVGGALLEYFWWGSVFLIAVPIMAALLVLGPILLPEYRDPGAGRLDLASAGLSLAAILSGVYGLKRIAESGVGGVALVAIGAGLFLGIVFVRRQRRLADPFIDLGLFRMPGFSASLALYGIAILVVSGGFLFLPQFLQLVRGLSPLEAGLWTIPWALAFVVGAVVTPSLARRWARWRIMATGLALSSLGFAAFAFMDGGVTFGYFAMASLLFAGGTGPVFTLTTDLILGAAPPERAGAAAALSETSAELGSALGIAFFGSIGVALYRAVMNDALPTDLPPGSAEIVLGTLGRAVAVAETLSPEAGGALLAASRDAFLAGLHASAAIGIVGALGLALFVVIALRGPEPERA